ncbi:MAG: nuclear transport factor 2 family protein [Thermoleophilaceae bacterium]|nr:nuclear transport factor 2 family protein [Thermoleophilaceae bacterium]
MSQENLAAAHAVLDAVEHRDLDALMHLTDPEVDWHSAFALGGHYRGHAGMRQYMKDMNDAWGIVRLDVEAKLGVGDIVVFVGNIHYKGKGSGVEDETRSGYVLKFHDGRCISFRPFREPEAALEALGLPE